jgi:hypothetical protein
VTERTCEFPAVEPSRDNPAGDCRRPATRATLYGSGHAAPLCEEHAARYPEGATFPVEQIDDDR